MVTLEKQFNPGSQEEKVGRDLMTVLQHYYTSCAGKGFQTNAMSKSLDKDTARVLEEKGVYIPPVSFPSQPTLEEIQKFPVSLSFFSLPGDRWSVMQSVYLGKDYSGRYGNYFSHSLVTENYESDFPHCLPIQLWKSPIWVSKESAQTDLPPFEGTIPDLSITWNDVFNFLGAGDRLSKLGQMITTVLNLSKNRHPIILVDTNQNIVLWIAAITFCLPYEIGKKVTFCTYNKNPYSLNVMICGTTTDSDFHFSQQEYNFQYTIFQFEENTFSPEKPVHPYAIIVLNSLKNRDSGAFERFSVFYKEVISKVPESAEELYHIYLLNSVIKGAVLSEKEWTDLLSFLRSYNFIDRNPQVLKFVIDQMSKTSFRSSDLVLQSLDFYQAVVRKGIQTDVTQIATKSALQTIFEYWPHAGEAEIARIRNAIQGMDFNPLKGTYAPKGTGLLHTLSSYESQRSLLRFLTDIKFILPDSPETGDIMDTVILPHIMEKDTQQFFLDLLKTEFHDPAMNSLGRYVANRQDDESVLSVISALVADDKIYTGFTTFAIKNNHLRLYRLLYKLRITPGKEVDQFLTYYSILSKFIIPSKISELNLVYTITWKDKDPTYPEVTRIIETLTDDDLELCDFSAKLAGILFKNVNLTNIPDTIRPVFEKIQKIGKFTNVQASLINLFSELRDLSDDNESSYHRIFKDIMGPSFNTYPDKQGEILEYLFRKIIISTTNPSIHEQFVKILVEVYDKDAPVHSAYRKGFTNDLMMSGHQAKLLADGFRIWDQYYTSGKIIPGAITDFLFTIYKDATNDMDRKKMRMSEKVRDLLVDPRVKQRYELYREKTEEKGLSSIFQGIFRKK